MDLVNKIISSSRYNKRLLVLIIDFLVSNFIIFLISYYYLINNNFKLLENFIFIIFISNSYIVSFLLFKIYKIIFRYYGLQSFLKFFLIAIFNYIIQILCIILFNLDELFYEFIFLQLVLFSISYNFIRLFISYIVINTFENRNTKKCLIYGTDQDSFEVYKILTEFNIIGFIYTDENKIGNRIDDIKIFDYENAGNIIVKYNISHLIVTIKNLSLDEKKDIFEKFGKFNIRIKFLTSVNKLIDSNLNLNDFQFNDILNRNIYIDYEKIKKNIYGKIILVTGAGGSIGSELVRQIVQQIPHKIILIDNNEYSLYKIESEILESPLIEEQKLQVETILTSIQHYENLEYIFKKHKPDIVYHAAAYKHVPMLETNVIETIKNNVFGTLNIIKLCDNFDVEQFVLISTDKAVRPSNMMGASKRISEICAQIYNSKKAKKTKYSIIRFGNVIGSNGSVIPLFNYQIQKGGPLTLTHQDITRYFMLIPEAVGLVLQSSYLTVGGEVFVLKMGKPIKIYDIAKKMIQLHGYTEKNKANPNGDIEIKIIGLRPGEKMHEELLIGNNPTDTSHPDIMMALEKMPDEIVFDNFLKKLEIYCEKFEIANIKNLIKENIEGFKNYNSIE